MKWYDDPELVKRSEAARLKKEKADTAARKKCLNLLRGKTIQDVLEVRHGELVMNLN